VNDDAVESTDVGFVFVEAGRTEGSEREAERDRVDVVDAVTGIISDVVCIEGAPVASGEGALFSTLGSLCGRLAGT
jgi:hypothetical protein